MLSSSLTNVLQDGSCLIDISEQKDATNLQAVLLRRLKKYAERVAVDEVHNLDDAMKLEDLQFLVARESLAVASRVQHILLQEEQASHLPNTSTTSLLIGTRDLAQLRTHLSISFNWALNPLLSRNGTNWTKEKRTTNTPKYAPQIYEDFAILLALTSQVFTLIFPTGLNGPISNTLITATLINRHVADVIHPALVLGWLPKSAESDSLTTAHDIRQLTMRFLAQLSPAQTITSLGSILSSTVPLVSYAKKTCGSLLTQQLLRPDGVLGLCAAVFGEGDVQVDDVSLEKFEHIARVLCTPPATNKEEGYFPVIIPRILSLLSEQHQPLHRRAAAYTISKLLAPETSAQATESAVQVILRELHTPLLSLSSEEQKTNPEVALSRIIIFMSNIDPSPHAITRLLSPIIPSLYAMHLHLHGNKTSDPAQKEAILTLMVTWGKITSQEDCIETLQGIIAGNGGFWRSDQSNGLIRLQRPDMSSSLELLTPNDPSEIDMDTNILNLYPDPKHFVDVLKDITRPDVASEIFVALLEEYRKGQARQRNNPLKALLHLQLIVQMQTQLSGGDATSNILCQPTHILSFVKHVLETSSLGSSTQPSNATSASLAQLDLHRMGSLNLHDDLPDDNDSVEEYDSDDDIPGATVVSSDDQMLETAMNLLLSVLEANEELSARTEPILADIFSLLDDVSKLASNQLQSLAREARMVMIARLASESKPKGGRRDDGVHALYQKALKLLQDPILPVRAHGLMLLRQLISRRPEHEEGAIDSAFIPAILSIFLQSIQDNESYIFLNAVQGLAAMVDRFGREVITSILREYSQGLEGPQAASLAQQVVDTKIRIGEALAVAIHRTGAALGLYMDFIVPTLMRVMRSKDAPTVIRTSSISLLADCEKTHPLAILPYLADLAPAMIDLLQVEGIPSTSASKQGELPLVIDDAPTSTNSKFPPLRRSALHFLQLLIREATKAALESDSEFLTLPPDFISRAKHTLNYISSTDGDAIVRLMAREASEGLEQLLRAAIGLEW